MTQSVQIINVGADANSNAQDHSAVKNPAANFGKYHQEFGYEPINKDDLPPEVPEIRVNGFLIEENQVLAEVQHHPAETKRKAMIKAAESIIIGELLRQKAVECGLLEPGSERNSVEESAALQRLIEQEAPVPEATEEEHQRFYEASKDKFVTSPILEAKHILLAAAPDDINERAIQKECADKLIAELKQNPQMFDRFVEQYSQCPSKEQNGNLGQLSKGQTVPEFEKALFAANEGLVDYPIESRYGFHIALVERKIEGQTLPYDYVKDKVAEYLAEKVQRKATAHYIQTLIQDADITGFTFDIQEGVMQ